MCNYSDAIWMESAYETILDLVRQKLISIQVAAKQLGMTEEEFCKRARIQKDQ